ncbi:MAG: hypothetical protein KAS90_02010 [Candidatus Aenigmarchaeota archaeon]|nr:hypothetical protein [Candidatus Aenigmarchaeota archaeon]
MSYKPDFSVVSIIKDNFIGNKKLIPDNIIGNIFFIEYEKDLEETLVSILVKL